MKKRALLLVSSSLLLLSTQNVSAQQGQSLCSKLQRYAGLCLQSGQPEPCLSRKVPAKLQKSIKEHLLASGQPEEIENSIQKFKLACLLACRSSKGEVEFPREDRICTSLKLPK